MVEKRRLLLGMAEQCHTVFLGIQRFRHLDLVLLLVLRRVPIIIMPINPIQLLEQRRQFLPKLVSVERFKKVRVENILADVGLDNHEDWAVGDGLEEVGEGEVVLYETQTEPMDEDEGTRIVEVVPSARRIAD